MKRILYIAPHCYPMKSSESIYNCKVAYTLAKAGFQVDVYTCAKQSTYPSDVKIDTILRDSDNLTITTVVGKVMSRRMNLFKLLKLMAHYLVIFLRTGYYYNGIDYPYQIVKAIKAKIKKEGRMPYDVMITRGFNTDYAGIYMARKYGLKWIANWNDPFPNEKFPAPYGKGYDAKLPALRQRVYDDIQKYADLHTFPCERLRNYMLKCFTSVSMDKTMVIHHMAHSEIRVDKPVMDNQKLVLLHSGSVNKPRDPSNFLKALANMVSDSSRKIKCVFVGGYDSSIKHLVDEYQLNDYIQFKPSVSYSESLDYLAAAQLSLIIEAECEEGIYLPTKFVDALQSHTPVLCVSPASGTLCDIVRRYNVGYVCDNTSVEDIERVLKQVVRDFENGAIPCVDLERTKCFFNDYILEQYRRIL